MDIDGRTGLRIIAADAPVDIYSVGGIGHSIQVAFLQIIIYNGFLLRAAGIGKSFPIRVSEGPAARAGQELISLVYNDNIKLKIIIAHLSKFLYSDSGSDRGDRFFIKIF